MKNFWCYFKIRIKSWKNWKKKLKKKVEKKISVWKRMTLPPRLVKILRKKDCTDFVLFRSRLFIIFGLKKRLIPHESYGFILVWSNESEFYNTIISSDFCRIIGKPNDSHDGTQSHINPHIIWDNLRNLRICIYVDVIASWSYISTNRAIFGQFECRVK